MLNKPRQVFLDPNISLSSSTLARLRQCLAAPSSAKPSSPLVPALPRPIYRQAAVLVCLSNILVSRRPSILLTVRAQTLRAHPGEISLPGGHEDPAVDDSLLSTAIRETKEEIGIQPHQIECLGQLDPLLNHTSTSLVTPFVAFIHPPTSSHSPSTESFIPRPVTPPTHVPLPSFQLGSTCFQSAEVASVFQVPLSTLLSPTRQIRSGFRMGPYLEWDLGPETTGFSEPARHGSDESQAAEVAERRRLRLWGLSGWVIYSFLEKLHLL